MAVHRGRGPVAEVAEASPDQVDAAVNAAQRAFDSWSRTTPGERGALLLKLADRIEGRADDAIIRGGFKVQPETVKRVLESHPAVREAAVAGLPDIRLGEVPVAAVEVEPHQLAPEPAELTALCRSRLTPYEVPAHIVVLDALPRTPSSKVSRVELLGLVRDRLGQKEEQR